MKKIPLFFSSLVFFAFAIALGLYASGNIPRSIINLGEPDAFGIVVAVICMMLSVAYGVSNLVTCFKGAVSCK